MTSVDLEKLCLYNVIPRAQPKSYTKDALEKPQLNESSVLKYVQVTGRQEKKTETKEIRKNKEKTKMKWQINS